MKNKKSGLIPYYKDGDFFKFFCMVPSNPLYGGTDPQIAKGEIELDENPQQAAIREATEELGLVEDNIQNLIFFEQMNGIFFYAAEVMNPYNWGTPHFETGSVLWVWENNLEIIREWQRPIIEHLLSILRQS
jgi:8-oxo-dGTP pyrophosphatase MutT (NUDIX family)